jgi:type I restriction-modification system DNA methylase subunit
MDAILAYTQGVQSEFKTQIAREHAYRPHLKQLLEAMEEGLLAVNDPKHSEGGAPDFIILRGRLPIAFLEAKDIGVSLDKVAKTDQMGRYKQAYGNLILTNCLEFRWYFDGQLTESVTIGAKKKDEIRYDETAFPKLDSLLRRYLNTVIPTISNTEELAEKLAVLTRDIATLIELYLDDNSSPQLLSQKLVFEQELLPNLTHAQFADMYAQTLAYGLFATRIDYVGKPENFTLKEAFLGLPKTNPFLRKMFLNFATELDERVQRWGEAIAQLLAQTKIDDILANFGKRTQQTDPVIHFYEHFLGVYNPQEREKRGVYYTPEPVVNYMIRSVDRLLQQNFGREEGLADKSTLILDPSTGTGTFLYFAIQHIHEKIVTIGEQKGRWNAYVSENLLKRLFGFELLMAPYAIAHMKLQILLKELGYDFKAQERLGIYLTNALEPLQAQQQQLKEGLRAQLSEEAQKAYDIKDTQPIMVVIGNPPYSGHSATPSRLTKINTKDNRTWIGRLLEPYFYVDGKRLQERNPKWLNDDYVKFIRMGQERIQKTGYGVLAFVTNHSYLDNPTFRGMRQSLMQTFSDIYILDLHGNAKKQEVTPDGASDKNVFDIQQGVAIGIFVKNPDKKTTQATVHHGHVWGGQRKTKFAWLDTHNVTDTDWEILAPQSPNYLFIPQNKSNEAEYLAHWKVTDIFPTHSVGIVTARDKLTIAKSPKQLMARIQDFARRTVADARNHYELGPDARDWSVAMAQDDLKNTGLSEALIKPIFYRLFDTNYTYYNGNTKGFICMPRREVMQHMLKGNNMGLVTCRQQATPNKWSLVGVVNGLMESSYLSNKTKEINYLFPLYCYRNGDLGLNGDDVLPYDDNGRRPNINMAFVRALETRLNKTLMRDFMPESIFHYIYAILHSDLYRTRYAEFLRLDFPRIPLPKTWQQFEALATLGAELTDIHLMTSRALSRHGITFPEVGNDTVEKGYPKFYDGRVYINAVQYFGNVSETEWETMMGGYQILHKWLKDRIGRPLSDDEMVQYQRIVKNIRETLHLMQATEGWV